MNKNILIIGGEGYVGSVVISELLNENYNIFSIDNLIYNQNNKIRSYFNNKLYNFINIDIRNNYFNEIDFSKFSAIIIFAGLVGDPITKLYPKESIQINEKAIMRTIDHSCSFNNDNIIFISTCSNYGLIKDDSYANEEHELNPLSLYSKSKVKIEEYIKLKNSAINSTILRFATAFGLSERMRFDLTLNEFTKDIFLKKELEVYDPDTWRPYCHVKDFAKLISIVLSSPKDLIKNQIFNAGSNQNNYTKRSIIKCISRNINSDNLIKYLPKGKDARNYKVDFSKVKNMLGFTADYSLDYGVKEIINAFKNNKFLNINKNFQNYGNYKILK